MKKRVVSFFLVVSILSAMITYLPTTVSASTEGVYGCLAYSIDEGKVFINDCRSSTIDAITIPSTIEGYPVTFINNMAFSGRTNITSIYIPPSVTDIRDGAFLDCSSLTSVTIPNSVKTIGSSAFENCKSLASITIPDSVTSIGHSAFLGTAFYNDKSNWENESVLYIGDCLISANYLQSGDYKIKSGTRYIAEQAFRNCRLLTGITIPDSVTHVGRNAFLDCASLTNITIPDSIISIGGGAFSRTAFYNDKSNWENGNVLYIGNHLIVADGLVSSDYMIKNGTICIADYAFNSYSFRNSITGITIPNSVKHIGAAAFYDCSGLTSIVIPNSVKSIGECAFYCCSGLTSIVISNSVKHIGAAAFYYCIGLTSIVIPNSVTSIGDRAFEGCGSLANIRIPDSVTTIGDYAFDGCTSLTSITIPNSVTSFGWGIFRDCVSLKSATIQNGVERIGDGAFSNCENLTSITIPSSVQSIGSGAFNYCKSLTNITIPDSVESIGSGAFYECSGLTNITIPNSITRIEGGTFMGCDALTSITIPDSVTSIGGATFNNCKNLKSIIIPNSVTSIEYYAFEFSGLKDIYYSGSEAEWENIDIDETNYFILENTVTIHYNYKSDDAIILSNTKVFAQPYTCQNIYVYKFDGVTPYDKTFEVTSSDPDVVTTSNIGSTIILSFNSKGSATVTVSATDGSGAKENCDIIVEWQDETEERYLLTRFALCQTTYTENGLKEGLTIGQQGANNKWVMFYHSLKDTVKWEMFYKQYINDYRVIKTMSDTSGGFYGAAFESPTGDVIIAYRGTANAEGIETDVEMVLGWLDGQFNSALDLYDKTMEYIDKSDNPDRRITVTGHSLGGALASYVAINRNVRCDNINGATGWLLRNDVIAKRDRYLVDYRGFDKNVYEHFNNNFDMFNKMVTTWGNVEPLNYSTYADTDTDNKKRTVVRINGKIELAEETFVYRHGVSSIINYSDDKFSLTEKVKEHTGNGVIKTADYFVGTSKDDYHLFPNKPKIRHDQGRGPIRYYAPKDYYVLTGSGDDEIIIPEGGDDILIGNGGNDTLNGGAGNDTYVYGGDFGDDIIIDPSGKDTVLFTDALLSDIVISGNSIICGTNTIEFSNQVRRPTDFTIVDKEKNSKTMGAEEIGLFALSATDATKGVQIFGNAIVEVYDAAEELIDTIVVNEDTTDIVEYKDYGMVVLSPGAVGLTLSPDGYIIKVMADEIISAWTVSDADNPTVAKQTFVENADLSGGSSLVINTGEVVEEQLSVRLISAITEEEIYSEAPEELMITGNNTEIKTGESITLSVPGAFVASVEWESRNKNVSITKNEDMSVTITGIKSGEETVRAYLPNDESYSAEFSFKVLADSAPDVAVTCNEADYDGSETAMDFVFFEVPIPDGYDKVIFDTESTYSQIEDTNNEFVITETGEHIVNIYCKNSTTGAKTEAFCFEFSLDGEVPQISGVENDGVYYTDRVIEVSDNALDSVYINGELCAGENFIISEIGTYTIIATDKAGNIAETSFEIMAMPDVTELNGETYEVVKKIRSDFDEVMELLSAERAEELEALISALEVAQNNLYVVTVYEGTEIKTMNYEEFNEYSPYELEGYIFAGWYLDSSYSPDTKITSLSQEDGIMLSVYARYIPVDQQVLINKADILYQNGTFVADLEFNYVLCECEVKFEITDEFGQIVGQESVFLQKDSTSAYIEVPFDSDGNGYDVTISFVDADLNEVGTFISQYIIAEAKPKELDISAYISNYDYDYKKVTYTIGFTNSEVDCTVIASMHSIEDEKLETVAKKIVEAGATSVDIELPVKADDNVHLVKIFFWNSLNQMEPLTVPIYAQFYAERERVESGDYSYVLSDGQATIVGYCGEETQISVPETLDGYHVTGIEYLGGMGIHTITKVELPETVKNIGWWAFDGFEKLVSVTVADENQYFASEDGVLFSKDKSTLVKYPAGKTASAYTTPDSVKKIASGAFADMVSLVELTLSDNVTSIDEYAFGASNIKTINVSKGVTDIVAYAFGYMLYLETIIVSDENPAFLSEGSVLYNKDKTKLICYPMSKSDTSFEIPESVTQIEASAFEMCEKLRSVIIHPNVTKIGQYAFGGCQSLINVYYTGSKEDWGKIDFGGDNIGVDESIITYDYVK